MKNKQPTGLKDKTGREILVGDKIEFEDHYEAEFHGMEIETKRGIVKFAFGCFHINSDGERFPLYRIPFILGDDGRYIDRKSYLIISPAKAKKQNKKNGRRNIHLIVGRGNRYKDGGTLCFQTKFINTAGKESIRFIYQDYRIDSDTPGEFFDEYPGDKKAKKIKPENIQLNNSTRY